MKKTRTPSENVPDEIPESLWSAVWYLLRQCFTPRTIKRIGIFVACVVVFLALYGGVLSLLRYLSNSPVRAMTEAPYKSAHVAMLFAVGADTTNLSNSMAFEESTSVVPGNPQCHLLIAQELLASSRLGGDQTPWVSSRPGKSTWDIPLSNSFDVVESFRDQIPGMTYSKRREFTGKEARDVVLTFSDKSVIHDLQPPTGEMTGYRDSIVRIAFVSDQSARDFASRLKHARLACRLLEALPFSDFFGEEGPKVNVPPGTG
jgi:hypothetical protein